MNLYYQGQLRTSASMEVIPSEFDEDGLHSILSFPLN